MRRASFALVAVFVALALAGPAAAGYKGKIAGGTLTLTGDKKGGKVTLLLKKRAPGTLVVDVGSNGSADLTFARSRFTRVTLNAGAGNDVVTISGKNGVFANQELTRVNGGPGNDKLTGAKGPEIFTGGPGKDTIAGAGGDDVFVWDPGDGADKADGAAGFDAFDSAGGSGNDTFSVGPAGSRVHVSINGAVINLSGTEIVSMFGAGGNDTIASGLVPGVTIAADGGLGNDTVSGATEADFLFGGPGNDTIDGNGGDDIVLLEDGDDSFVWNHGDGNDFLDGGDGAGDTFAFNGSSAIETIAAGPNADGDGLQVTRNVDNVIVDAFAFESLAVNPLEGTDSVTVGNLTGTGVTSVGVDLGVAAAGDAAGDTVAVQGTAGNDVIAVAGVGTVAQVTGLSAQVNVSNAESVSDVLRIESGGGNDTLSGGNLASIVGFAVDAGDGDDIISGGNGADFLFGGVGSDGIDGNAGADTLLLGGDDDSVIWDPGDGSDIVEGAGGDDTLVFNGAPAAEVFALSAVGVRLQLARNLGAITMDMDDLETVTLNAGGGADTITVNDLSPTDADSLSVDLGAGDLATDTVVLNGTSGVDLVGISGSAGSVAVGTTSLQIALTSSDPFIDELTVNAMAGADQIGAASLGLTSIHVTLNGGNDADIIAGSPGNDTLNGQAGDDLIQAGDASDTIDGGADTDYCDGGPGIDIGSNCETSVNIP